jgi:hypothetical protein
MPYPGTVRGPDPLREGHRAAEPPLEGLRPEPAVVRGRRAGLIAWTQMIALAGQARRWEPKRLRLRIFASPAASRQAGAGCASASPSDGPGPATSPPPSPACKPCPPTDRPEHHCNQGRRTPRGPVEPPPTRRDSRAARHAKSTTSETDQATTPDTRNIEAKTLLYPKSISRRGRHPTR